MIRHADSHVDHGLTEAQLRHIFERFADRDSFFIETITLPADLGTVSCGLYGPRMMDPPVPESDVEYAPRGVRPWVSRLVSLPVRPTNIVTVIAGPHEEACARCGGEGQIGAWKAAIPCPSCTRGKVQHACILYTAFGGPATPQEPGDPNCKDPAASAAFWREHALAR